MQASTVKVLIYAANTRHRRVLQRTERLRRCGRASAAVNHVVVIAFLAIGFIDYVFSQLLLANHPQLSQVRG